MNQEELDTIAKALGVKYKVLDNLSFGKKTYSVSLTLTNNADIPLKSSGEWAIYFCHIRMVEPDSLPEESEVALKDYGVKFSHVNGCLFTIQPLQCFKTLNKGDSVEIIFKAQYYSVARSDLMPNWYMTAGTGLKPALISSTCGDDLDYVQPFDAPASWKRFDYKLTNGLPRYDRYDPFTPQVRYHHNFVEDLKKPGQLVLPTPAFTTVLEDSEYLDLTSGDWVIATHGDFMHIAEFFNDKLNQGNMVIRDIKSVEKDRMCTVFLEQGEISVKLPDGENNSDEAYTVKVDNKRIEITGNSGSGVFYGVQTVLALCENDKIPSNHIIDCPRFPYRGMHLDVSRNFHKKEDVLKLLDSMAMYKMNKFHFHLTDDEGWRLEIPGLEELTTVGSMRGHDLSEKTCILPMLGSGPDFSTSGSGFYSVSDYKEILTYAKNRYIEVIPEIDMPGHSHAAVKAMKARYDRFMKTNDKEAAKEYLLSDMSDVDVFQSVQMFSENSMNPGVESTYNFVDKVVREVKEMHKDISPLSVFHFGGDEVPYEAWEGSPACQKLVLSKEVKSTDELMEYFVKRVAKIVAKHGLSLGAWQDGVIHDEIILSPVKRSKFPNKEVYVYAWQNVWESGLAGCSYKLANMGYKVIMAQGTHLYFDHPYEPDPEERGLYWANRYLDVQKTFSFMPDNIYKNADVKLSGEPIKMEQLKLSDDYEALKENQNVIGMQGQLWSELVRTPEALYSMIYPRLIALAERAWHKAPWESLEGKSLKTDQKADWTLFANSLGYRELARLDTMGVTYHIPPPGAKVKDGVLDIVSAYPGLSIYYRFEEGKEWQEFSGEVKLSPGDTVQLLCKSADKKRSSRVVLLKDEEETKEEEKKEDEEKLNAENSEKD